MRKNFQKKQNLVEIGALTRCFYREFSTLSDFLYYSIILEKGYPEFSEIFDSAAISETECVKDIGASILYLGGDPRIEVAHKPIAIKPRDPCEIKASEIKRLLSASAENIKRTLSEYERLLNTVCDANTVAILTRVSLKKRDLLYVFEQMICS